MGTQSHGSGAIPDGRVTEGREKRGDGALFRDRSYPMLHVFSSLFIHKVLAGFVLGCCLCLIPNAVHSAATNSATLQWAANSESDLAGYRVYQGTTAGVYSQSIEVGNVTTYTIANLQTSLTHYFAITAYDLSGNESYPSEEVSQYIADSSLDVTSPAISLTSPTNDTSLSGTVTLTAAATDNIGVVGVQFQLNGTNLGAEDTTTPFSLSWDTTGVTPGPYTVTAIARDAAGNTTTSAPLNISISSPPSTLSVSIAGNGSVASSPNGILCTSGTCAASYGTGSTVTLIGKASKKWNFAGWSGACNGTGECVIQLSEDQFVGATFSQGGKGAGNGKGRKK